MTLALANKESLVAAGDLAVAAWKRGGGLLLPVDSEHSALFQCLDGHAPQTVDSVVLTASGGPFRNRSADGPRISDRGGGARTSDVVDGPEDHDRLGHAREQGSRADRGALPLRPRLRATSRSSCTRPRSSTRSCASETARRSRTSDTRTCACRSRSRSRTRSAGRPRCPASTSRPASRSSSSRPISSAFRCSALAREAGERGGTFPCAFNAANEVAVAAFLDGRIRFPEIARLVEDALAGVDGAPARDLTELVEADGEARRLAQGRLARSVSSSSRSSVSPSSSSSTRPATSSPRSPSGFARGGSTSASRRRSRRRRAAASSTGSARSRSAAS